MYLALCPSLSVEHLEHPKTTIILTLCHLIFIPLLMFSKLLWKTVSRNVCSLLLRRKTHKTQPHLATLQCCGFRHKTYTLLTVWKLKTLILPPRSSKLWKKLVLLWCFYLILQLVSKLCGVWWWVVWCGQWEEEAFSGRTKLRVVVSSGADWKHCAAEWNNESRMQFHLTKWCSWEQLTPP